MSRHGERETNRRQPPAADGLDQAIRRQVKQAQVGKRRRTGDGRAETEERETEDGGKANARSGASPIGRTGNLGNTVISYAPWVLGGSASEGKRLHPRVTASRHTASSGLVYREAQPIQGHSRYPGETKQS